MKRDRFTATLGLGVMLSAPIPLVARAEVYLTEDQAAKILFPSVVLTAKWVELGDAQVAKIEKSSGERVRDRKVRVWLGAKGEAVIIDRVVGKHEFITYAAAIAPDAKVRGVEIMDYRETYGHEVKRAEWRQQFVGKGSGDPIRVERDIKNISGATLSSVHIAAGVRRLVYTYEFLKSQG